MESISNFKEGLVYGSIYLSPETWKELKAASDNERLQAEIIKNIFNKEKNFIEQEMREIDEGNLKWRAKLLEVKDTFSKSQEDTIKLYDEIYDKASGSLSRLEGNINGYKKRIESMGDSIERVKYLVADINNSVGSLNIERIERLFALVDKYNSMSDEEKELMSLMIKK